MTNNTTQTSNLFRIPTRPARTLDGETRALIYLVAALVPVVAYVMAVAL